MFGQGSSRDSWAPREYSYDEVVKELEKREPKEVQARIEAGLEKFAKYDAATRLVVCRDGLNRIGLGYANGIPIMRDGNIRIATVDELRKQVSEMAALQPDELLNGSDVPDIVFDDVSSDETNENVMVRLKAIFETHLKDQRPDAFEGLISLRGLDDDREIAISYGGDYKTYKKFRVGDLRPLIEDVKNPENQLTGGHVFDFRIAAYGDLDNFLRFKQMQVQKQMEHDRKQA